MKNAIVSTLLAIPPAMGVAALLVIPSARGQTPTAQRPLPSNWKVASDDTPPGSVPRGLPPGFAREKQTDTPSHGSGVPAPLRATGEPAPQTPAAVSRDIDEQDSKVRAGLAELKKAVEELEKDRKDWAKMDKSVHTARAVNAGLLGKAEAMVAAHAERIEPALKTLKDRLKAAPDLYSKLAADRRAKAAAATSDAERDSYATQATLADAAASLCRARYREVYESPDPNVLSAADALGQSMAQLRRMADAHRGWAEVLDAWPSTLNDPKLGDMVDQLNRYCEDMVAQQKGMAKLTDALKATAAGEGKR